MAFDCARPNIIPFATFVHFKNNLIHSKPFKPDNWHNWNEFTAVNSFAKVEYDLLDPSITILIYYRDSHQ